MKRNINFIPVICLIILFIALNASTQDITPQKNGVLYSFQVADMYFEVDSSFGGRISSLKLGDDEVMFVDREYSGGILWGSTLWPSPQSAWGWPPSTILDSEPYYGGISGKKVILVSDVDGASNLVFKKTFFASEADTSVTIIYTLINEGLDTINNAAWEVTRVPPGGLTFFPSGEGSVTGALAVYVEKQNNVSWYEYNSSDIGNRKLFSDGSNGWFVHVNDNSVLFIKQFEDVYHDSTAPGENEIELWLNGDHAYIELENQSKYNSIAPGDSIVYALKWYLRQIPGNIDVSVGSNTLVNYVSNIIGAGNFTNINSPSYKNYKINVSVNSATGYAAFKNLPDGTLKVEIYDLTGKVIKAEKVTSNDKYLFVGDLQHGIYAYIISNKSIIGSGKLVVE